MPAREKRGGYAGRLSRRFRAHRRRRACSGARRSVAVRVWSTIEAPGREGRPRGALERASKEPIATIPETGCPGPQGSDCVSHWTILCDFDGTVSVEDITDSLLERFARPGWQKIEQAWRRGEIGSHDCMAEQVALLDASREEIDAH